MTRVGVLLTILYVGRDVLMPITFAVMLSLLVAPLVRLLRRTGLGRHASVLLAVLTVALSAAVVVASLGLQVVRIAQRFPQYEATVHQKLETLDQLTVGRLRVLEWNSGRPLTLPDPTAAAAPPTDGAGARPGPALAAAINAKSPPLGLAASLAGAVWAPIQATGIVLLVLVFVLLEHESLRDRFIRVAGATDIRATTLALTDAGERLSRYFVSQFAVNLAFGAGIWLILTLLHLPQAMLLGAIAALMRFVPYVGVGIAALLAAILAFAVDPGWSLATGVLGAFILLDVAVGQLVEPHLYGHATGLSPLSVVVAAIFWGAIWGPVGLILSTPLTLCLVVAGRHVKSLGVLELLLSDAQPLTLPQRFYQRALAGDPQEIIAGARDFLTRGSFAEYCDRVVMPALHLARLDADTGATTEDQHARIRGVIVDVVATLTDRGARLPRRRRRASVLDPGNAGRMLRRQRESLSGRWQGPLGVPAGSVIVCLGVASSDDDLAAELLVRLLRGQGFDARHFSPGDLDDGLPPGADPGGVSLVCVVSAFPGPERDDVTRLGERAHALLPFAHLEPVLLPGVTGWPELGTPDDAPHGCTHSFVQAMQVCIAWREARHQTTSVALDADTPSAPFASST
jgi:predicted PurR-regulated permease PerM